MGSSLSPRSQAIFIKDIETLFGITQNSIFELMQSKVLDSKILASQILVSGYIIDKGPLEPKRPEELNFIITENFEKHVIDLLRVITGSELPILIEGPTSCGKTSVIQYLAALAGHKCVRVNNHQHTEIDEYIGNYLPDERGKLTFNEGVLVKALKEGHWLILDELNLAKSEILENLNRLLDDNRELFVNETQTFLKPHKNFRIFATQNPSFYGGRKELSKAFKNRFI